MGMLCWILARDWSEEDIDQSDIVINIGLGLFQQPLGTP
jgi:hypothetical protein